MTALRLWWVEHHAYADLVLAPDAVSAVALAQAQPDSYGSESAYQASDAGPVDAPRFVAHIQ